MTAPEEKVEAVMSPSAEGEDKGPTKTALKREAKRLAKEKEKQAKELIKAASAAQAAANPSTGGGGSKKKEKPTAAPEPEFVNTTPEGEKKDMSQPMASAYNPKAVEAAWYSWWEKSGFFKPELVGGQLKPKGSYVVPIPPPNVTGSLHLGHALTNSIQDALIRWKRMSGYSTVYMPGCDHAGIATQAVVEKKLWKESKKTRHELGREKFIEMVWKWKEEYGGRIYNQLRRLGSSYDWSQVCFTMDQKFVVAVTEAFVRLHEEGTIYRDTRLVNWCCKLNTALSNLEVENRELTGKTLLNVPGHDPNKKYEFGVIISFAYPIEGSSEERIIVATTRLETMLGDSAIAVHPLDPRFTHLIGKNVVHPFNGRLIPIIADEMVDREFGSGAVKITPAHDPNDYAVGKRHNLPFINIFNDDGTINANGAPFEGLLRFDARVEVLKRLKEKGLYIETKPNPMSIPICSRTGDVIEPLLKPQWYVNCQQMAKDAMKAVHDGELTIFPKASEKEWFGWLENIQDWCISRQLWWGHTIPAYFIDVEGETNDRADGNFWVSGRTREEALQKAAAKFPHIAKEKLILIQDEDVLDTWFSSALWPFGIFGWPEKTQELELFYPNSLLETGWDILFFWVARMVMMGIKLTGKVPFRHVFCHAMVRDAHGRKMSKSLGNVIDPLDVIQGITLEELHKQLEAGNLDPKEVAKAKDGQKRDFPGGIPECGTDALRFTLCAYTASNRDINLDVMRVEGYRKFGNKLWNATKFALMKLGDNFIPAAQPILNAEKLSVLEKWILYRLNLCIREVNVNFDDYNFMNVTSAIHKFWLYELCDVYIEAIKPICDGDDSDKRESVRQTLYTCLDQGLKLLHPFMPFLTEELYQRLPRRQEDNAPSIMVAQYPEWVSKWDLPEEEKKFETINQICRAARSLMSDYGLKSNVKMFAVCTDAELRQLMVEQRETIITLAFTKNLEYQLLDSVDKLPKGCALQSVNQHCNVYILVRGMVDLDAEIEKLRVKSEKTALTRDQIMKKMNMDEYETRVRADVRETDAARLSALNAEIEAFSKGIEKFMSLKD